jgi:DNA polymerase-2
MQKYFEGFVVHAYTGVHRGSSRLYLVGRLKNGETFAVVEERESPGFYLRSSEQQHAKLLLKNSGGQWKECNLSTIDGERCVRVTWNTTQQSQGATRVLAGHRIRTYEGDIRFTDQFLMARGIHGSLKIHGSYRKGRWVDRVFLNPKTVPSDWQPSLSILSVDTETSPKGEEIYAIGLVFKNPWTPLEKREVLFSGSIRKNEQVTPYPDEKSMLLGFCKRIVEWDPDIITGWNVIDFDFNIIARRMKHHALPLQIGRSQMPATFLPGERGRYHTVIVPGRQVLDAVRLVRAAPERFSDYTLETVAKGVLGRGKRLIRNTNESTIQAIMRLYREDPLSLCLYCMEDARLVIDILEKTGLIDLTLRRCLLIGISLDRAWTSIPSFDYIYIEALHRKNRVAPTIGVDTLPSIEARGGIILEPKTGLYNNVWIFDFKSLYPSIIRTFNIDPLSFVLPEQLGEMPDNVQQRLITAPNGATFRRDPAILPELLEKFFVSRDDAKDRGDKVASHVYKIIMNTFYGVMGAIGSRFASGYLSGAITSFGHHILQWCERYLEQMGFRVLYGDTDSLFVLSGLPMDMATQELLGKSRDICFNINKDLKRYIRDVFDVNSYLDLEFEKIYYKFFLPPVRSNTASEGKGFRGRAKGYAGLLVPPSQLKGSGQSEVQSGWIEVVGMEAVRRDWTDLAKGFQIGLLAHLFHESDVDTIRAFTREILKKLNDGKLDEKLVYSKSLRKPIWDYKRSIPPHVRAASMLDTEDQHGIIRYLWTTGGPQPESKRTDPIDYNHYVEKQLKPIFQSFTEVLHTDLDDLFHENEQLRLF